MGKRRLINPHAKIVYGVPHRTTKKKSYEIDEEITRALERRDQELERQQKNEESTESPDTFQRAQVRKLLEVLRDLDPAMRRAALSKPEYALAMLDQIARGEEPCLGLLQDDENLDED